MWYGSYKRTQSQKLTNLQTYTSSIGHNQKDHKFITNGDNCLVDDVFVLINKILRMGAEHGMSHKGAVNMPNVKAVFTQNISSLALYESVCDKV